VVVNRAKHVRSSIAAACLKSIHFSAWNNGRGNDANQLAMLKTDLADPVYARCMIAALEAAYKLEADPTDGARHYHTAGVRPKWAKGKSYEMIGHHRFYRGIK
jgi:hypothetical protein